MSETSVSKAKTLILCLSVALILTVGVGTVTAEDESIGFADGNAIEQQGDIITTTVFLNNTDQIRLQIDAAQGDFSTTVLVTDGNEDGEVTVTFDTLRANDPESAFGIATEADTLSVRNHQVTGMPARLPTGRYNVIASTGATRIAGVIWIEPPTVRGSTSCTLPAGTESVTRACEAGPSDRRTVDRDLLSVANGDTVVARYHLGGLESLLRSDYPGAQLVFANDSRPGARTSHLLQLTPQEGVTGEALYVDYESDAKPSFRGSSPIKHIGVDTDGDGVIDRSLSLAVGGFRTSSSGQLTIFFNREISVATNETLLVEFDVVNPQDAGTESVTVSFGELETRGNVRYGPGGTLGHGIDLRLESSSTEIVAPLSATDVSYDGRDNTLDAVVNTSGLPPGAYNVILTVDSDTYPRDTRYRLTERFNIEEPTVQDFQASADRGQVTATARTNLAQGTEVSIRLRSSQGGLEYLALCITDVEEDMSISCTFDPPTGDASVAIVHDGTTMAGPQRVVVTGDTDNTTAANAS